MTALRPLLRQVNARPGPGATYPKWTCQQSGVLTCPNGTWPAPPRRTRQGIRGAQRAPATADATSRAAAATTKATVTSVVLGLRATFVPSRPYASVSEAEVRAAKNLPPVMR